jgi:hypothetical protein
MSKARTKAGKLSRKTLPRICGAKSFGGKERQKKPFPNLCDPKNAVAVFSGGIQAVN